jgi:shikimate dehydrogenase
MRLFGLIGYPLSHSFSKKYFTEKFEKEGLRDCVYENFPISGIHELKNILALPGLQGLNVTIPYKEQVIPYLHQASDAAKKINACNCIKIAGGKLYGFNTDIAGFENSLTSKLNPASHQQALILGTGGSSKAVKYVLGKLGIKFKIISRKPSAGNLSYEQITKEIILAHKLIINTTPLGMFPNVVEAPPLPYQFLTPDHFLFDLIYNPEKTLFLKKGEEQGAQIQNGFEMLMMQAEANWKIWNNEELLTIDF